MLASKKERDDTVRQYLELREHQTAPLPIGSLPSQEKIRPEVPSRESRSSRLRRKPELLGFVSRKEKQALKLELLRDAEVSLEKTCTSYLRRKQDWLRSYERRALQLSLVRARLAESRLRIACHGLE